MTRWRRDMGSVSVELAILMPAFLVLVALAVVGAEAEGRGRSGEGGAGMINVKGLHKRHGTLEVLRGINISVRPGEVAAIIGPSGGGKSTFLRCLNGLERFQGGTVCIDELTLEPGQAEAAREEVLRQIRRRVGMVFQSFNLFPHLSVIQNVIEAPIRDVHGDVVATVRARWLLSPAAPGAARPPTEAP